MVNFIRYIIPKRWTNIVKYSQDKELKNIPNVVLKIG